QTEISLQQWSPVSGSVGQLHSLLVVPNAVRGQLNQPIGHLRCAGPILSILESRQSQLELFRHPVVFTQRQQLLRQSQVEVGIFGIIQHPVLQVCQRVRHGRRRTDLWRTKSASSESLESSELDTSGSVVNPVSLSGRDTVRSSGKSRGLLGASTAKSSGLAWSVAKLFSDVS